MLFVYQVVNPEGTWVQLDKNSVVEFCESDEGEAWSLARDRGGNQYLRNDEGKSYSNKQNDEKIFFHSCLSNVVTYITR